MSDLFSTVDLVIAATFVCVVLAVVVWMRVDPNGKRGKQDSRSGDQRIGALLIKAGHCAMAAVTFAVGILLGVAINGLAQLIFAGAWVAAFNIVVLAASLFLIVLLHDRLGERLFPSGIRPARNAKKVPKPLARRLSMPAGLVLGVVMASLGLDDRFLVWLY